jgi:DNA mismatch endonuclease, patch repair protein
MDRSGIMRAVKSRDTRPELVVRHLVHRLSFRFRLHRSGLPGTPDLVFPGKRRVIFVHGCFWHGHSCRRGARIPKTNSDYWCQKVARNRNRDQRALKELQDQGWTSLVIWECDLIDVACVTTSITDFLSHSEMVHR